MKKAELEQRLAEAEKTLQAILGICYRSEDDLLKEFNEESLRIVGKAIYDHSSVYPLKAGMIEAEAEFYFNKVK